MIPVDSFMKHLEKSVGDAYNELDYDADGNEIDRDLDRRSVHDSRLDAAVKKTGKFTFTTCRACRTTFELRKWITSCPFCYTSVEG